MAYMERIGTAEAGDTVANLCPYSIGDRLVPTVPRACLGGVE